MIYEFHPEARLEYREAAVFYDSRRAGLGTAFTLEIEATIDRIMEAPSRWPVIEQDVRKWSLTYFLTAFSTPLNRTWF